MSSPQKKPHAHSIYSFPSQKTPTVNSHFPCFVPLSYWSTSLVHPNSLVALRAGLLALQLFCKTDSVEMSLVVSCQHCSLGHLVLLPTLTLLSDNHWVCTTRGIGSQEAHPFSFCSSQAGRWRYLPHAEKSLQLVWKEGTISSSWCTALHAFLASCWAKKTNFILLAAVVYVASNTCAFRGDFQYKPERSALAFDHSFLLPPSASYSRRTLFFPLSPV